MALSCHFLSGPSQFFSLLWSFMILTLSKTTNQLFCRMSLNLHLFNIFP